MSIADITQVVEALSFIIFIALVALAVMRMLLRVIAYRMTGREASIILRRDILLMSSFLITFGSPVVISFFGWGDLFFEGGTSRLWYVLFRNSIAIAALAYWVWAEYFVIGVEGKEKD